MKKFKWFLVDFIVVAIILSLCITLVVLGKMNWMWGCIFLIATYIFNFIFVIFNIYNDDNENEKLAWNFFMLMVPIVGIVFYLIFRIRRPNGKKIEDFEKEFSTYEINKFENIDYKKDLMNWQSKLVKRNFYETNFRIFEYSFQSYDSILEDIKNAEKYVHIEMYIIKKSEIYERLKKILFQKVLEGVEVKIIFDKFGSWKVPIDEFKYLRSKGIELYFYNIPIYPWVRYTDNQRLHRKFFIIDGKVVYFGGLNISDEYNSQAKKYGYWADTNFRATGKVVNDYESVFLYDWNKVSKGMLLDKSKYLCRNHEFKENNGKILTFEQGPTKRVSYLEDSVDHWINFSLEKIQIITPYFIPTKKIFNSLKNALKRNVELEIFIPGKYDKAFTYNATLFWTNQLAKCGAKIYKINETFLHAKFGIFDNKYCYTGTNNLDMRSFYTNQESINLIFSEQTIKDLNKLINNYKKISIQIEYKASKFKNLFKQFLFKLVAPLM